MRILISTNLLNASKELIPHFKAPQELGSQAVYFCWSCHDDAFAKLHPLLQVFCPNVEIEHEGIEVPIMGTMQTLLTAVSYKQY